MDYFFDSYAIIEIINQNESYLRYKDCVIITNLLHLAEVYYYLLLNHNVKTADYWAARLDFSFLDFSEEVSLKASAFKFKHKKLKLSYADCMGYITVRKHGLFFLTGDRQFKEMSGVEFVK